jgi:hypothetical protein
MLTQDLAVIAPDEAQERLASTAPVLISEHEVAFATSIALRTRPPARSRWAEATHALVAAVHRTVAPPTHDDRKPRRDYPRRYAYLENACMAREIERL